MDQYCAANQMDQLEILKTEFSEFTPVWGPCFSWPSVSADQFARREFGNLTLTKPLLLDAQSHPLPRPATPDKRQMQRIAIETVINSKAGCLGIINTHLAFHDDQENLQQIKRLQLLETERYARLNAPGEVIPGCYEQQFQPTARILCGDFNFGTDSQQYQYQRKQGWIDAWALSNHNTPHAPTCGIFDRDQWPQGPHCRDFFWISSELENIKFSVAVDTEIQLSDHQPVLLELDI